MARYYVNNKSQPSGDHEVHREDCHLLPADRTYLGDFASCGPAITEAKKTHPSADGCRSCSPACHTS